MELYRRTFANLAILTNSSYITVNLTIHYYYINNLFVRTCFTTGYSCGTIGTVSDEAALVFSFFKIKGVIALGARVL